MPKLISFPASSRANKLPFMRQNIINFCVDDIRGSISSIYWENVPNLGVRGGEGGNSISFFLSWGCVRDSGGVDLQTKL